MLWENLTSIQFTEAVETAQGVCLIPIGVLEKHGDHLPLGTDMLLARALAHRAAQTEPVLVFPPYFFTQIFEARHTPGTVGIDSQVMYNLLQAVCDEIGRNGLDKIMLLNTHGGNRYFLRHFIMLQLEQPRDYVVYLPNMESWLRAETFSNQWAEMRQSDLRNEHAGESETSMVLAVAPDLVNNSALPNEEGLAQNRLASLQAADIYNAIEWYADWPHHYSGQGEYGSAEKGEFILNYLTERLVEAIRLVKADDQSLALQQEFFQELTQMEKGLKRQSSAG